MLTLSGIQEIVGRYKEKRPLFEELAAAVRKRIVGRLEEQEIRHIVTMRAKSPVSLERKLMRIAREDQKRREEGKEPKYPYSAFADSLSPPLKDLAAVRILLYLPDEMEPTLSIIDEEGLFVINDSNSFPVQPGKVGYQAEHRCVFLPDEESEFSGVLCEIQVCSITEHIWNELEHDIIYKQYKGGEPDRFQTETLNNLHHVLEATSKMVDSLMKYTREMNQSKNKEISTVSDFQLYLHGKYGGTLSGNFVPLLDFLATFNQKVTPARLDELISTSQWNENRAKNGIGAYDPDGDKEDAGWITLILMEHVPLPQITDWVDGLDEPPPLCKMMKRIAVSRLQGGSE